MDAGFRGFSMSSVPSKVACPKLPWSTSPARIANGRLKFQLSSGEIALTIRVISFAAIIALGAAPALAMAAPAPKPGSAAAPAATAQRPSLPTRAELLKNLEARFKAIDTNGDGVITQAEFAAAEAKVLQSRLAEARSRMETEFQKLDTNKDGQLSKAEFMAAAPQVPTTPPDVTAAFERLDTNK